MKILGIDPGTATTGYGIIEANHGDLKMIEYGCIETSKKKSAADRLAEIHHDLNKLIKKYKPRIIAVESLFFFKNLKTAIAVAQARGVVLMCAAENHLKLVEFTPLQVKKTLTNYGKAEKKQVQFMVQKLLDLPSVPKPDDAADALAIAICGSNYKTI
ncbi:MAG: crossover junction endodeoxyribonuclease RuvC [bacterium]|nr:crossover junction endodeoxyribonuclease RuvC [bacterium]